MDDRAPAHAPVLQVWHVDLDAEGEHLDVLEARGQWLSPGERDEHDPPSALPAGRERSVRRRRGRIALRILLARAGVSAARGTPMSAGPGGKPHLGSSNGLDFSVSYSGSHCLVAIGAPGPIGIDLERPREVLINGNRRALILAAGAALAGKTPLPQPLTHTPHPEIVVAWTRLEALAKARGDGIGKLLEALGITARGAAALKPADIEARATALLAESGLALTGLDVPAPGIATLVAPAVTLAVHQPCVAASFADGD